MKNIKITDQVPNAPLPENRLHTNDELELEALDHMATDDRATDATTRGLTDITPAHAE